MDTDKLNRELQIFRNHVKIVRENVVHKLVRDIKFWKAKQQTNPDNQRAAKKVQSHEQLLAHIRTQTASELTKAVIRFKKQKKSKPDAACSKELTVEERTLKRFHENKKLEPEVKALIRRFALNSKMEVLDKYLKNRGEGKKARKEKGKKKRKDKEKKARKEKVPEQESEDQGFCEEEDAPKKQLSNEDDSESLGSISVSESEESNNQVTDDEGDVAGKFVRLTLSKPKAVKPDLKHQARAKSSKVPIGKKDKKKEPVKSLEEEEDDEDKCIQIQDSFFVTSTGQSYVATAPVVNKKQQEEEEEFSWKRTNRMKDILGNKEERPQKRPFNKEVDDVHPSWKAKQQQKGIYQYQGNRKQFDDDFSGTTAKRPRDQQPDADLHPSWAAKQKQKGFQPFAGKKTTFDTAAVPNPTSTAAPSDDLHPSWAAKQKHKGIKPFAGKKITFDASDAPNPTLETAPSENLHPSWAAKQKQKGIKPFAGKKIVFDSNEPAKMEQKVHVSADVHPSWAAKQKQKGLKPFQGKKIVFDSVDVVKPSAQPVPPPADLHPSWAAKQKEKGLKEFRGKKITFDD